MMPFSVDPTDFDRPDPRIDAMSPEEVRAELDKYRHGARRWNQRDHLQAATEAAVASATGIRAPDIHPLAAQHLNRGPVGPTRLAELIAAAEGRPWSSTHGEIVALATTSAHYPSAITELARGALSAIPKETSFIEIDLMDMATPKNNA